MRKLHLLAAVAAVLLMATPAEARDQIRIVGSSTVYPFSTTVAETFGKTTQFKTPVVESTGSGGGLKLFCGGIGTDHPDITNASRQIKSSEIELCKKNGVTSIHEALVGYDGIAIANAKGAVQYDLTVRDMFMALAMYVPDANGTLIKNPFQTWNDIAIHLPKVKIEVLGPPPTSGTRDAFLELVMEAGAKTFPSLKELRKTDKKRFKAVAHGIREDGAYVEAGENDNLIVQKLVANKDAVGIFGYSFLANNSDKVQGSYMNGSLPTFDNIADGTYPVSRSLFFYVKHQHIGSIPGIKEFVEEFMSDKATGEYGYLTDRGLIPAPEGTVRMREVK